MTSRRLDTGRARIIRGAVVALSTVMAISVAGCGSQASDAEIAAALGGGSVPAGVPAAQTALDQSTAAAPALGGQPTGVGAPAPGAGPARSETSTSSAGTAADTGAKADRQPAGAAAAAQPVAATKSVVKIGQLGVFSGVLGVLTEPIPKTLSAWAAYQNANGGLNGHPIKIIVGDNQGDPSTGLTIARRMVESDKIIAMAGNLDVFGFPQVEQYMRSKNVAMIGDGIDPGWYQSPIAFPVLSHTPIQVVKGLKAFVDQGVTKIAIAYCLEVATLCTYFTDYAKKSEIGKYIVQDYQVSLVAPSYTSQCLRMKQGGIEALYLLMDSAAAARFAQDCATQGFKPKTMLLGLDATAEMPKIAALDGTFIPGATVSPAAKGLPALDLMHQALGTYAPGLGDSGASGYAWVAGLMVGIAGKNLPENPTPADFLAGLWTVKNNDLGGLTSPITYPKGQPAKVGSCMFLWSVSGGKWTAPQGAARVC